MFEVKRSSSSTAILSAIFEMVAFTHYVRDTACRHMQLDGHVLKQRRSSLSPCGMYCDNCLSERQANKLIVTNIVEQILSLVKAPWKSWIMASLFENMLLASLMATFSEVVYSLMNLAHSSVCCPRFFSRVGLREGCYQTLSIP